MKSYRLFLMQTVVSFLNQHGEGGNAMNWKFVRQHKKASVLVSGCAVLAAGFGFEYLLTLQISFLGMPGAAALFFGMCATTPLCYSLNGDRRASKITAFLFAAVVAVLYFFGEAIGYVLIALDPSSFNFFPLLHGYDFYWYFYLTGAALTMIGAFLPHPAKVEAN